MIYLVYLYMHLLTCKLQSSYLYIFTQLTGPAVLSFDMKTTLLLLTFLSSAWHTAALSTK